MFKSGGCIDFGQALLRAASLAQRNAGNMPPPAYTPSNGWYAAPPPAYTATPGSYGWLPQNSAFGNAPANGVFVRFIIIIFSVPTNSVVSYLSILDDR